MFRPKKIVFTILINAVIILARLHPYYGFRSNHRRCSIKKLFLKILQYSQENNCVGVSGLKACNFIKKRLETRYFPMNIVKFLRASILKNICERLLLWLTYYVTVKIISHDPYIFFFYCDCCKVDLEDSSEF